MVVGLGIQWIGGIIHSLVSLIGITSGLVHSQTDTWVITEVLTIGQGILLLRIWASHVVIDIGIVESHWKDWPSFNHRVDYGQELWERRF